MARRKSKPQAWAVDDESFEDGDGSEGSGGIVEVSDHDETDAVFCAAPAPAATASFAAKLAVARAAKTALSTAAAPSRSSRAWTEAELHKLADAAIEFELTSSMNRIPCDVPHFLPVAQTLLREIESVRSTEDIQSKLKNILTEPPGSMKSGARKLRETVLRLKLLPAASAAAAAPAARAPVPPSPHASPDRRRPAAKSSASSALEPEPAAPRSRAAAASVGSPHARATTAPPPASRAAAATAVAAPAPSAASSAASPARAKAGIKRSRAAASSSAAPEEPEEEKEPDEEAVRLHAIMKSRQEAVAATRSALVSCGEQLAELTTLLSTKVRPLIDDEDARREYDTAWRMLQAVNKKTVQPAVAKVADKDSVDEMLLMMRLWQEAGEPPS